MFTALIPPENEVSTLAVKIEEDSYFRHLPGLIPLIGIVTNVYQERRLADQISRTNDPQLLIRLIEIKNDYKITSMSREKLQILLSGLLMTQPTYVVAGAILGIGSIFNYSLNAYYFYQNKKVIEILEKGFEPELVIM